MLQRDGVVMVKMKVLMMMVMKMLIRMRPSSMVMMMATISPLREGISPADFCLPESFLSLRVFSAPQRRRSLSLIPPLVLGFRERRYAPGALAEVGQGGHTTGWHGQGLARATWWCGPLAAPLALSFWLLSSSDEI
jgi:hypothetical protein